MVQVCFQPGSPSHSFFLPLSLFVKEQAQSFSRPCSIPHTQNTNRAQLPHFTVQVRTTIIRENNKLPELVFSLLLLGVSTGHIFSINKDYHCFPQTNRSFNVVDRSRLTIHISSLDRKS